MNTMCSDIGGTMRPFSSRSLRTLTRLTGFSRCFDFVQAYRLSSSASSLFRSGLSGSLSAFVFGAESSEGTARLAEQLIRRLVGFLYRPQKVGKAARLSR
jgi:hypothetical protein